MVYWESRAYEIENYRIGKYLSIRYNGKTRKKQSDRVGWDRRVDFAGSDFRLYFWEPQPEIIQGEAEATEVRISGKVPGRIERFMASEGDRVQKGDTLVILWSPDVQAKFEQARAAEAAALAMNKKVDNGSRSEQLAMAYQNWQKALAALDIAQKSYERVQVLFENEVVSAQKKMRQKPTIKQ